MNKIIFIAAFILLSVKSWSQDNRVTLSGGYSFANIEDVNTNTSGWRINGLYEFNPKAGKLLHGFSVGYISTSADYSSSLGQTVSTSEYKISSLPIYYAPKLLFGNGSAKGFIKGALGIHFSNLKRTGSLGELSASDAGFYGGASLGFMKIFNDKFFINLEYEWAYLSNAYYKDGFMNSAMLGIGINF